MIITHNRYLPSYGLGQDDQGPVCINTMLSINEQVRDCAAYEAVGPDLSHPNFQHIEETPFIEKMKGGGNKIDEFKAREMFPEIDQMELRYRK